jgi:hypothetical protein
MVLFSLICFSIQIGGQPWYLFFQFSTSTTGGWADLARTEPKQWFTGPKLFRVGYSFPIGWSTWVGMVFDSSRFFQYVINW